MADRPIPRWAWSAAAVAMVFISCGVLVLVVHPSAGAYLAGTGALVLCVARLILAWRHGW